VSLFWLYISNAGNLPQSVDFTRAECNNDLSAKKLKKWGVLSMNDIPMYLPTQNFFSESSLFFVDHFILPKCFPLHRHDFIEIEFFVSGEGTEIINGVEYEIKKGSLVILMPWHIHEIIPRDNQLELFKCSFRAESFIDNNTPFFELSDIIFKDFTLPPYANLDGANFEKVSTLLEEIQQEYCNMDLWKDTLIKSKITEILIYFDRCRKSADFPYEIRPDGQNKFNIWKVIEYVHAMFNQDVTLGGVSNKFHYSESYINKMLRQNIGLNFEELLQEVRIRNACAAMTYSMFTITEVSLYVGYKSKEAFYRAFKNVKGLSPEKYRKFTLNRDSSGKMTTHSVLNTQIIYYLHLHHSENLTLRMIAQHFHYNETYLCDVLMQVGMSFTDLLHEIRIYHACSLLLTTDKPVNEIAFSVGFDSTETFFRVFKKLREISPGEFRKKQCMKTDYNKIESDATGTY
jgi:AraC-type DNA-binding domain-containing proteins